MAINKKNKNYLLLIKEYKKIYVNNKDNIAKFLRRLTRNQLGFPAQVRILVLSNFFYIQKKRKK